MIDLLLVAVGFGLLPFLATLLFAFPDVLRRNEAAAWGLAAGVIAFLGLAHAGSVLIEGNAFLRYESNPYAAALVAVVGLLAGILVGWKLLGGAASEDAPGASALLWATVAFVAIHSFTDGLVLGGGYAGPAAAGVILDPVAVGGTALHRFAEGSLIVLAALAAGWRPQKAAGLLLVGLLTVPAAYIPVAALAPGSLSLTTVALDQAISVLGAGLEAGLAIVLLALGLLPRLHDAKDSRWAIWAGVGFTLLLLVHYLVE